MARHNELHIDPKNHPDVPKIRNTNDIAEGLITAGIAILVNDREGDAAGCEGC